VSPRLPLIAQRLPLEEARRAHEVLGEGGVLGEIVLLPKPGGTGLPITVPQVDSACPVAR